MTALGADDNRPFIQSLAFSGAAVQITFLERRDSEGPSTLEKVLTFSPESGDMDLFTEMMDSIHIWLDEALRVHRLTTPEQFKGRR